MRLSKYDKNLTKANKLTRYNTSPSTMNILSYLSIAAEVSRSNRVGGCEGGGRRYGGQGAIWSASSSTALLSSSFTLTGPSTPEDPAPQGGRAAGGAAWRVTGRAGDRKRQQRERKRFRQVTTHACSFIFHCKTFLRKAVNVRLWRKTAGVSYLTIACNLKLPIEATQGLILTDTAA